MGPTQSVGAWQGGGAKKAGGQKKGPGSLMGAQAKPPYLETPVIMHNLLLVESYRRKVGGRALVPGSGRVFPR